MAIYYVKSGGTATGDDGRVTSARTGSFADMLAANYYDSIYAVFAGLVPATAPVNGDSIYVSDSHAKAYTGASISLGVNISGNIVAVQDLLCENYTNKIDGTGANETMGDGTAGFNLRVLDLAEITVGWYGVSVFCNSSLLIFANQRDGITLHIRDCYLKWAANITSTVLKLVSGNGGYITCDNVIFEAYTYTANNAIEFDNGTNVLLTECTFLTSNGFDVQTNGGGKIVVRNSDFSACSTSGVLVAYMWQTGSDGGHIEAHNCIFPSGFGLGSTQPGNTIKAVGCHDTNGSYYYSRGKDFLGEYNTELATVLRGSYDGTNKFTTKMWSTTETDYGLPFKVKLSTLPAQDLRSDKTYTVEFTCANVLTDKDFWIDLTRPDATNQTLGVTQSNRADNILSTGVTHTVSTAKWALPLTYTYKISITVAGMSGVENGTVEINLNLAKPSETVIIDTAVVVS